MASSHNVKHGDCISSIALQNGLFPGTLWNHPDNANLKSLRKNPNILNTGDVVVVPDPEPKQLQGATDARHRFVRKGVPEMLHLQIEDEEGEPVDGAEYTIDLDGRIIEGVTDADGWINEPIPPDANGGTLEVMVENELHEHELQLGYLDPIEEMTGVQARLQNLGYECAVNGDLDEPTKEALKMFQLTHGLESSGEPDDATRNALVEEHNG
jgi:hypothetical protein